LVVNTACIINLRRNSAKRKTTDLGLFKTF